MKIQIETLGCKVNSVEAESIAEMFRERGHKIVKRGADVVVINTCCVTSEAESKSRQAIRKALKNGSQVAVMGCYSQLSPNEMHDLGVSVIVGTAERQSLVDKVESMIDQPKISLSNFEKVFNDNHEKISLELPSDYEELPHVPSKTRAFIKIQDGCNGRCTYCIIPKVRGRSRSRSLESIKRECENLANYKEIVLTGINLGMYGADINLNLTDAIKVVLENSDARIRLSSIEPNEVTDELIEFIKNEPRICKHMHIPVQSCSDEVLQMMHRNYRAEDFKNILEELRSKIPSITIGTDIIVAFPGESMAMFLETVNLLEVLPLSYIHVFGYSQRPGTIAAEMTQIASQKKKVRIGRILTLAAKKNSLYRQSLIGNEAEILTEVKKNDLVEGHSGEYIKVYIAGDVPLNEIVKVKLTEVYSDGMLGTII
ncbi:MAG: tRNA (N(6)-L-threonylcarbamoyladenosine(37)-C(2))-methylthiotransferase MtaB [Selenomonadaceae bacterium]|nr:tRNA (N(6)-L-threonylcarbamoyladenosine(37)-C(2))-methylthiotransferase MtaB [Selenomonadaceae bacterium]